MWAQWVAAPLPAKEAGRTEEQCAEELVGDDAAKRVQLMLAYDPAPPFRSGHLGVSDPRVVEAVKRAVSESVARRARLLDRAAARQAGLGS